MAEAGEAGDQGPVKPETMTIVVKDQSGGEVQFKIKPHTKFSKVMEAYCSKKGIDKSTVRFLNDGERIRPEQTPSELELEDGDTIDAAIEQVGGQSTLQ